MADYPEPADPAYVTFGRAAELLADADPCLTVDEVMERLKRAIFSGEFDGQHGNAHEPGGEWLQIQVKIPRAELTDEDRAFNVHPKRYYQMNRSSIAGVILCEDGLPGDPDMLDRWIYRDIGERHRAYRLLVQAPLSTFPDIGQQMIADIRVSRARLKNWLDANGYSPPACLCRAQPPKPIDSRDTNGAVSGYEPQHEDSRRPHGRPELPAWQDVRDYIVDAYAADPTRPHKVLAHEARAAALRLYGEVDTPSEGTILRRMKEILNN